MPRLVSLSLPFHIHLTHPTPQNPSARSSTSLLRKSAAGRWRKQNQNNKQSAEPVIPIRGLRSGICHFLPDDGNKSCCAASQSCCQRRFSKSTRQLAALRKTGILHHVVMSTQRFKWRPRATLTYSHTYICLISDKLYFQVICMFLSFDWFTFSKRNGV